MCADECPILGDNNSWYYGDRSAKICMYESCPLHRKMITSIGTITYYCLTSCDWYGYKFRFLDECRTACPSDARYYAASDYICSKYCDSLIFIENS